MCILNMQIKVRPHAVFVDTLNEHTESMLSVIKENYGLSLRNRFFGLRLKDQTEYIFCAVKTMIYLLGVYVKKLHVLQ